MKLLFLFVFFCLNEFSFQQEIGVDIMPSTHYIINKQDLLRLKQEIDHDLRKRISDIEESWAANEAVRQVSSGVWNLQGSQLMDTEYPGFIPSNGLKTMGLQANKEAQAIKAYYQNAVNPPKEKVRSPSVLDSLSNQMIKANDQVESLKESVLKANKAAKSVETNLEILNNKNQKNDQIEEVKNENSENNDNPNPTGAEEKNQNTESEAEKQENIEKFPMNFLQNEKFENTLTQSQDKKIEPINKSQSLNSATITNQNGPVPEKNKKYRGFLNRA